MNEIEAFHGLPGGQRLEVLWGDITDERVDAIVNAANSHLMHGGGVAAAIIHRGGRVIEEESLDWVKKHGLVSHESPAYTSAGKLPCGYVIHAVGPVWGSGDEDHKLQQAITGSLRLAEQLELQSIAFPPISTGIFGFPKERAARVILAAIYQYFRDVPQSRLSLVRLTILDRPTLVIFLKEFRRMNQEMETI